MSLRGRMGTMGGANKADQGGAAKGRGGGGVWGVVPAGAVFMVTGGEGVGVVLATGESKGKGNRAGKAVRGCVTSSLEDCEFLSSQQRFDLWTGT